MRFHFDDEWLKKKIKEEENYEISVGDFETAMKRIYKLVEYEQEEPDDED